ncbi:MAG: hypothetical protein K6E19_01375 [Lachnospiraceae bacterium]|nr:hypothetical protein [Lachnospiraceae bacterium]
MKRKLTVFLLLVIMILSLAGCGSKSEDSKALKQYNDKMTIFFDELVVINDTINEIEPENTSSLQELFTQFDILETKFEYLATIKVPQELVYYDSIESLAAEGSDYMKQANEYLHMAFEDGAYNENYIEPAMECYRRANKRIRYIVSLIHGEVPNDAQ